MARPKPAPHPTPHDVAAMNRLRISFIRRGILNVDGLDEPVLLIDLARHGAFVERREALPLGSEVSLCFSLPGNEIPVRVACRVAWTHESGAPGVAWEQGGERSSSAPRPPSSGSDAGVNPAPVPWGLRRERSSSAPKPPSGSHALPHGLGLEFVALSAVDLARVDALLIEHLGRPPRARQFSGRHLQR